MSAGTSCAGGGNSDRPRVLNYEGLNDVAKTLLQRRPLHPHRDEVFRLLKITQMSFLRNNNIVVKSSDNKAQLTDRILDLVQRTSTMADGVRGDRGGPPPVVGVSEELLRSLTVDSVGLLRKMECESRSQLENLLLEFGGAVSDELSKEELLRQLAELLYEQNRAENSLDIQQRGQAVQRRQSSRPECCMCMEEYVSAAFSPCGHAISCVDCAGKVSQCPMCRKPIASILQLYFA